MSIVLQVIGALFVLFVVSILIIYIVIRIKLKQLGMALGDLAGAGSTPSKIHLDTVDSPKWDNSAAVEALTRDLESLGFDTRGAYSIREMPGLQLKEMRQSDENVFAVIYDQGAIGNWIDLFVKYEDGTSYTVSNAPSGGGLDQHPDHQKVYLPNLEPKTLYAEFESKRPKQTIAEVEDFIQLFEQGYADEMAWRNSRGGTTEEEIRRIASASGQEVSEEEIKAVRQIEMQRATDELWQECKEEFLNTTTISAAEWDRVGQDAVIVFDQMSADQVRELVEDYLDEDINITWPDGLQAREAFAQVNENLPDRWQFKKLGSVSKPTDADVYAAPEFE